MAKLLTLFFLWRKRECGSAYINGYLWACLSTFHLNSKSDGGNGGER